MILHPELPQNHYDQNNNISTSQIPKSLAAPFMSVAAQNNTRAMTRVQLCKAIKYVESKQQQPLRGQF